jgi:hypothetical protein
VLKVDKDYEPDSALQRQYVQDTIIILARHNLKVVWIKTSKTQHGRHYYFRINRPVDALTTNELQFLIGDDSKRVAYNEARIRSSLPGWNKLFEKQDAKLTIIYRLDL